MFTSSSIRPLVTHMIQDVIVRDDLPLKQYTHNRRPDKDILWDAVIDNVSPVNLCAKPYQGFARLRLYIMVAPNKYEQALDVGMKLIETLTRDPLMLENDEGLYGLALRQDHVTVHPRQAGVSPVVLELNGYARLSGMPAAI